MGWILFATLVLASVPVCVRAEAMPVMQEQETALCLHLLPLPHEVSIKSQVALRPADVGIRVQGGAGEVEQQAVAELRALFREKAGLEPVGAGFEIAIGVPDAGGQVAGIRVEGLDRLKQLPNSEQAYLLLPVGEKRIVVAGLKGPGVYYGVRTLCQLLEPGMTRDRVSIPLATVVDWPDLAERGLWNHDLDLVPWLATLKINFALLHAPPQTIARDQPIRARIPTARSLPNVLEAARLRAMHPVAVVMHLNYIGENQKAYAAYPELAGRGDESLPGARYGSRNIRVPCATNPRWKTLLAEYMEVLAAQGAREISAWGSEHRGQCACEPCRRAGQFRAETESIVDAWRQARKQYPELSLRIFYCMGGKDVEDTRQCLLALPAEVKIERCYGAFGQAFDACAAEGRWLASYAGPPLENASYSGTRFYAASRTREFVRGLLDRKWRGIYSINYVYSTAAYQRALYDFGISALAEYAWNAGGRSVREFAIAWATREGHAHPEQLGEWVERMDPVERALNTTANTPFRTPSWLQVSEAIRKKTAVPAGDGVFEAFAKPGSFKERLAACRHALPVAEAAGRPELVLETQYAAALIRVLQALRGLADGAPAGDREKVQAGLADFRAQVEELMGVMDRKTDLLRTEPREFADSMKEAHRARWRKVLDEVSVAVGVLGQ